MKKLYFLLILLITINGAWAQLYESFNYTVGQNVGGSCNPHPCSNNNWTTHFTQATGTINVLSGSLSYTGLQASSGNKIKIPGNNTTTSRAINTPTSIAIGPQIAYYSFLINILDNSQLSTGYNTESYFISFGNEAGNSVGVVYGRVAASSVNAGANFRLGVYNGAGGGTPTYSEIATDLNFGTTYLVVVKYQITTAGPDIATLWVNPSSLGGTEPGGGISNSSVDGIPVTTFASVVINNNIASPNAEIDEIRAGLTWASVTPNSVVLPLTLVRFNAQKRNNKITILSWQTSAEVNVSRFEIQRSKDGISYTSLSTTTASNSAGLHDYTVTDMAPLNGLNYYRLKMIDVDGKWALSNIAKVDFTKNITLNIFPNPAAEEILVQSDKAIEQIAIVDIKGRIVTQFLPSQNNRYNIRSLQPGVYTVRVSDNQNIESIQLIVY